MPTNCLNVFDHFVGLALKGLVTLTDICYLNYSLATLKTFKNTDLYQYSNFTKCIRIGIFSKIC